MLMDKSSIHERSIFQLGDWHIVKSGFQQGDGFAGVFAVHTNCEQTNFDSSEPVRIYKNRCFRCGVVVPDELQALVILYAWGWEEQ